MIQYLLIGCSFAFAASVQPGPLQAFLLASVARRGWRRTLPAALAPVISDGPIALLALVLLTRVSDVVLRLLQAAGGVLLLILAFGVFRQWRRGGPEEALAEGSGPQTLLQAVLVNLLNPNPYLGWTLVLGPAAVRAWHEQPARAFVLIGSFYAVIIAGLAATIFLFGASHRLGPRGRRALLLASALALAGLGIAQLATGMVRLVSPG